MGVGSSIENAKGWKSQYLSMSRWYQRCEDAHVEDCYINFHDAWDYGISFFIASHSLKDWLKKQCPNYVAPPYPLCMKICRDIANRAKHLTINDPALDAHWSMLREWDHYANANEGGARLILFFDDQKASRLERHAMLTIIRDCKSFWDKTLEDQDMLAQ